MSRLRTVRRLAALFSATCLLAACHRAPPTELVAGAYRAVLTLPGGELPFGLTIAVADGRPPVAYVLNGAEAVHITEFAHEGTTLVLRLPGSANRLELSADPGGYHGEAVIVRPGDALARLPLRVVRGERHRFATVAPKIPSRIGGRWALTFKAADGRQRSAVGEFKQLGSRLFGTILGSDGDHRYLEGDVTESEVLLSSFDGSSASLYRAKINADGSLSGHWWSGNWAAEEFTAHAEDSAHVEMAPLLSAPAPMRLSFSFPDLAGKAVSLADERFHGKVVIVAACGTWNLRCHDQATFLATLYKTFKTDGLEIVSLQFEALAERAAAIEVNRRFVALYGIEWPVLLAGPADLAAASQALPALAPLRAFPTTVLIARDGQVRRLQTGFVGPASGLHQEDFRHEFTDALRALLAEKP